MHRGALSETRTVHVLVVDVRRDRCLVSLESFSSIYCAPTVRRNRSVQAYMGGAVPRSAGVVHAGGGHGLTFT